MLFLSSPRAGDCVFEREGLTGRPRLVESFLAERRAGCVQVWGRVLVDGRGRAERFPQGLRGGEEQDGAARPTLRGQQRGERIDVLGNSRPVAALLGQGQAALVAGARGHVVLLGGGDRAEAVQRGGFEVAKASSSAANRLSSNRRRAAG